MTTVFAAPLFTLSGTVETSDGHPVANAPIGLSILPGKLPSTPTPTVYIAQTVSAPDGAFSLPAPTLSQAALATAAANDGWLNLELDSSALIRTGNGDATFLGGEVLSVLVAHTTAVQAPLGTVRSTPNGGLLLLYGEKGYAVGTGLTIVNNELQKVPCLESNCIGASSGTAIDSQCGQDWYSIGNENDFEPVGEFHTWDDMSGSFTYGSTASTNLGVAFDYNTGDGWHAEGTAYMGTSYSYTTGSGLIGADYGYQQDAQFAWEQDESDSGCQGRPIYRTVPLWWTGGFGTGANVSSGDGPNNYWSVPTQYQADLRPGGPVDIDTGRGYTYTWQVSAFGITLSSETDYSNVERMHWDMGTAGVQHSLFGYGAPPDSQDVQLIFASTE